MKQIILLEPGKLELRDTPIPGPSDGEVVIKISAALTCGTDLKAFLRGHKLIPMPGPFGHEYSGTVAKAGKDVRDFREGDQVMGVHSAPCLECRYCKKGLYNLCELIMENKALGAFAEYLLLPSNVVRQNLFQKPDSLGFEQAALLEPFSCVIHPYGNINLEKIHTAVIIGAGPIGLIHLAYLKSNRITSIVCDESKERLSVADTLGAERTALPEEIQSITNQQTDGLGADLVVECTGQKNVWEKSVDYLRRGGTLILFGGCPSGETVTYDTHRLHYDAITLMGSFHYTPEDVRIAYKALTEQKTDVSPLISGEFALEDIEEAFTLLKEGKGIKYVIRP